MTNMQQVFQLVDTLTLEERYQLQAYLAQRRVMKWWIVPSENIAKLEAVLRPVHQQTASMTEEEINAVINEALAEVRRERQQN